MQDVAPKYHNKISIADKIALWDVGVPSFCLGDEFDPSGNGESKQAENAPADAQCDVGNTHGRDRSEHSNRQEVSFLLLNFVYTQSRTIIELMFFSFL